jgi:hypothetical protein
MLRDWLQTPALKRVLQNFMVLAGGRAAGGVLGFIATLLSARALGPEDFGVVAMISAYVLVVRGFCNIKPFEAIVRYGVALADDHDLEGLARLLRVSLALDAVSALSGTMIAVLVAWLGGPLMGWSSSTTTVAMWYSLILLGSGTATAKRLVAHLRPFRCHQPRTGVFQRVAPGRRGTGHATRRRQCQHHRRGMGHRAVHTVPRHLLVWRQGGVRAHVVAKAARPAGPR